MEKRKSMIITTTNIIISKQTDQKTKTSRTVTKIQREHLCSTEQITQLTNNPQLRILK